MWKGALALTAALAFAVVAFAAEEGSLDQARKLVAEAKPFVEKANDVDLDMAERKEPRREAFKRLIARYQDVVQSPPADHLPLIE